MRSIFFIGLVLVGLVNLIGCAPAVVKEAQLDQPFTLFVRERAQLGNLQIRFIGVPEDSRCPLDVECVWAGNAKIVLGVSLKDSDETVITINSTVDPQEALYAGYRIRFVSLKPERFSERLINPAEYRVTLIVSRAP